MNDFTFTNRAYDLLLNLREDGIIKDQVPTFTSIQDVRLAIDIVKTVYPLYKEANSATLKEFIQDIFNVNITSKEIDNANHEKEYYRPIEIQDIRPGITFKIIEKDGTWCYHTFWTYADTKRIIPLENTTLRNYHNAFMYIWEKAKRGKVFIKNVFLHRKDDIISHIDDPTSKGIIKERLFFTPNQYSIIWENTGKNNEIPLTYWFNENKLINITKLEAMPMKTNNIVQDTKNKKYTVTVRYKVFKPKEWIEENVLNGYDRQVYEKLAYDPANLKLKTQGWIEDERVLIIDKHKNISSVIRNYYRINKEEGYKDIEIISTKPIEYNRSKIIHKHTYKKTKKQINSISTDKVVSIKHFPTNVVSRVLKSEAQVLVNKPDSEYGFVSKHEYRKYRTLESTKSNEKDKTDGWVKTKFVKPEPKLSQMGTELVKNPTTGESELIPMIRKYRRSFKHKVTKGSRLVKEQFVTEIIPETKENIKIKDSTWEGKWADQVLKLIKPAHTVIKRILTSILPHKEIKLTDNIKLQRKERSEIDKNLYLKKSGKKSLSQLKEQFDADERRNNKFSALEKWSKVFEKLVVLITQHKLFDENDKFVAHIHNGSLTNMVGLVTTQEAKIHWPADKIRDFIRYIRLTTHGVFGNKLTKIKKVRQAKEFETLKTVTRIDYSKLKLNLPEENKTIYARLKFPESTMLIEKVGTYKEDQLFTITGEVLTDKNNIMSWKYLEKDEYKDLILDEGGGKTEVGVKFRPKDPEHIKKYFETQKINKQNGYSKKKNQIGETFEKSRKIQKPRRTSKGRSPRKNNKRT